MTRPRPFVPGGPRSFESFFGGVGEIPATRAPGPRHRAPVSEPAIIGVLRECLEAELPERAAVLEEGVHDPGLKSPLVQVEALGAGVVAGELELEPEEFPGVAPAGAPCEPPALEV